MASTIKETKPKTSSQVYIFYGEDDFSLTKKIERWKEEFAKKYSATGVVVFDGNVLSDSNLMNNLEQAIAPSLFASKKLVICKDCLPTKASQESLAEVILKLIVQNDPNSFFVFYSTKKLDRRLSAVKTILNSTANIVEFNLPHGSNLNAWLKAYSKQLMVELDDGAVEKLAVYLGRDLFEEKRFGGKVVERKEFFDLWQAHNELSKLSNYNSKITTSHVESLVIPKISENIFNLSDNIFNNNQKASLNLVENLFADQSIDEKSVAIKIVGLLTEQARALLLVTLLKEKNLNNQQIADMLGWSSGRVFMVLKQAGSVSVNFLKKLLKQLLSVDLSLKTSDVNPKLLINQLVTIPK